MNEGKGEGRSDLKFSRNVWIACGVVGGMKTESPLRGRET